MKRLLLVRLLRYQQCAAKSNDVRVRFAPSPTGKLHLGSLRTALFNYLFARANNGTFILRIEDTDQVRSIEGCTEEIQKILDDYGLRRDEGPNEGGKYGPYLQSQRTRLYKDAAQQLIDEGHAYRCFCTPERLEIIRKTAHQNKSNPRYDNRCREISREDSNARRHEPHTIRFKFDSGLVNIRDQNYGIINFEIDEGDFILMKSDGFPTYHLANVVDDRHMRISHVIRGQEWLGSTPKHVRLYEAFHVDSPTWIHLPLITRDGKHKLSKRDADAFVDYYRYEKGYLRLALLNFLIRNGSGIRNFDGFKFYTLEEMVEKFDASLIGTRSFQMDTFALDSYGRRSIHVASYDELFSEIRHFLSIHLPNCEPHLLTDDYLRKVLDFLLHNEENFSHLAQLIKPEYGKDRFSFLFTKPRDAIQPLPEFGHHGMRRILEQILQLPDSEWNLKGLQQLAQKLDVPYKKLFLLFRLAVIDNDAGPPVMELIEFFGIAECRKRIEEQLIHLVHEDFNGHQTIDEQIGLNDSHRVHQQTKGSPPPKTL